MSAPRSPAWAMLAAVLGCACNPTPPDADAPLDAMSSLDAALSADAATSDAGEDAPPDSHRNDPAAAVRITDNAHLDVLSIRLLGGSLEVRIDHANQPELLEPERAIIELRPGSSTRLPESPSLPFLGPPGSTVWELDAGWSVRDIPTGVLLHDELTIHMESVAGPGRVAVWRYGPSFEPDVAFASSEPLPQALIIGHRAHVHKEWAFTAPGHYHLVFRVSAVRASDGTSVESRRHRFTFVVLPD